MRNISLPLSAHECAASATIEAEPVTAAAPDLTTATSTFIRKATSTVVVLAELLVPPVQWNTSAPGPVASHRPDNRRGLGLPILSPLSRAAC